VFVLIQVMETMIACVRPTSQGQAAAVQDSGCAAKLSHCRMLRHCLRKTCYCLLYAELFSFVSLPTGKQHC